MKVMKRTPDEVSKRCELLKSYGLVLWEGDRRVYWNTPNGKVIWFDFSVVEEKDFTTYALDTMFYGVYNAGRELLKYDLSQLLELEE